MIGHIIHDQQRDNHALRIPAAAGFIVTRKRTLKRSVPATNCHSNRRTPFGRSVNFTRDKSARRLSDYGNSAADLPLSLIRVSRAADTFHSAPPLIQKDSAVFRHQHDLAPGCRARPVEVTRNGSPLSLWSDLLHPGHTLLVFLDSLALQNTMAAIGTTPNEAGGALRTLFIQRTPDRSEIKGVETLLDLKGRAHSRYRGARHPSWYLIRTDQFVAARGALEDMNPLRSHMRKTLAR